jgi:hypothetical protein
MVLSGKGSFPGSLDATRKSTTPTGALPGQTNGGSGALTRTGMHWKKQAATTIRQSAKAARAASNESRDSTDVAARSESVWRELKLRIA